MAHVEKDALTGTDTTGHEWDGIKELNTPLPRWWIYTFYATIVWSIGYWMVYPAWPTFSDYTKGMFGYSSRAEHAREMKDVKKSREVWSKEFEKKTVDEIAADRKLMQYAMAGGKMIFGDNCAPCHGSGGSGAKGYPILADNDWLWGGTRDAVYQTIRFGIRSEHKDARISDMPKYLTDQIISKEEADAVADYVLTLSGSGGKATDAGKKVFADNCAACHGEDGKGMMELGGPSLADKIWLHVEPTKAGVMGQLTLPKQGVMPAWAGRLSDVEIKQVSLYVHSLGGGSK
ncbi:MAG: cytochrome-c oxidase, cbb3-type subunit III [Magnetospirillum sp. WYHS-4]